MRFGSRAACAVDRNLSVRLRRRAFGQSAIPPQASGNHAAQSFCNNQPPLVSRRCRSSCGASGRRGQPQPAPAATDVIIVGAGAAGIAAARRIAAAGRRFVLIEASDHVGGRCITDTKTFGVPYDRGAHWIYVPDLNPLTKLAPRRGIEVYPAPPSQKVRIGRRNAREGELEDFLSAQVRATRAIGDAARKADVPASRRCRTISATGARPSNSCSARSAAARTWRRSRRRILRAPPSAPRRPSAGRVLARCSPRSPRASRSTVDAGDIDRTRRSLTVETPKGTITARAAIVTVSTNVIASGRIQFTPELPHRNIDAFGRLSLGSYDHIALELAGNPLGLDSDDLVFEKSSDTHTAAILGNVSGTPLCMVEVAGAFGRDLSAQGEAAMVDFAARLAGQALRRRHQEGDQPQPRDALEQRPLDARRLVGRGAGRPAGAPHPDGAGARCDLVCRRGRARDVVGHGRRRLGIRRARRRRRAAAASAAKTPAGGSRERAASPRRKARARRRASSRHSAATPSIMRPER